MGLAQRVYTGLFAPAFWGLSAARGDRSVHPQGVLCRGSLRIDRATPLAPRAQLLQAGEERPVLARFSRMAGLPERLGDVFGLAVRVPDAYGPGAHQDVLCNTSVDAPLLNQVFLPARRWFAQTYSSCLPYDGGAGPFVLGWLPPDGRGPDPSIAGIRAAVGGPGVCFAVGAAPVTRTFARVGELRLDALVEEPVDLDFDPVVNAGGGLGLTGPLNRARSAVYRSSRRGRGAPASTEQLVPRG